MHREIYIYIARFTMPMINSSNLLATFFDETTRTHNEIVSLVLSDLPSELFLLLSNEKLA